MFARIDTPIISSLLFPHESIIFSKAVEDLVSCIKKVLGNYTVTSGIIETALQTLWTFGKCSHMRITWSIQKLMWVNQRGELLLASMTK